MGMSIGPLVHIICIIVSLLFLSNMYLAFDSTENLTLCPQKHMDLDGQQLN